jgi:hypothetical protein
MTDMRRIADRQSMGRKLTGSFWGSRNDSGRSAQ